MDLQNFVSQSLTEIIRGIHKAKVDNYQLSSIIPGKVGGEEQHIETKVVFDIAVTTTKEDTKGASNELDAGGKIKVLGVDVGLSNKLGLNWGSAKSNTRVSRIAFEVPILLNKHHRADKSMPAERDFVLRKLNINGNE